MLKSGNDQVERLDRRGLHGLHAVFRFMDDPEAELLERHARHLSDTVLIVDD